MKTVNDNTDAQKAERTKIKELVKKICSKKGKNATKPAEVIPSGVKSKT